MENPEVVHALVSLLEDPSVKVKAHAIQCELGVARFVVSHCTRSRGAVIRV